MCTYILAVVHKYENVRTIMMRLLFAPRLVLCIRGDTFVLVPSEYTVSWKEDLES